MRFNNAFRHPIGSLVLVLLTLGVALPPSAQSKPCQPGWDAASFAWAEPPFIPNLLPTFWLGGTVMASAIFDDGTGPALYVAGETFEGFGSGLARFDGTAWTPVVEQTQSGPVGIGGTGNDRILTLTVFDDGSGPALYAGGFFTTINGQQFGNIAKWDGQQFSPLGQTPGTSGPVTCIETFDDGTGEALYVGGIFTGAGGAPANRVARWDGQAWSGVGDGILQWGTVSTLKAFDDGSGPALYAGTPLPPIEGNSSIKRFDGTTWQDLDTKFVSRVYDLEVFDDGTGPALIIGTQGVPVENGPPARLARWDGKSVAPISIPSPFDGSDRIYTLSVIDDEQGKALYLGGTGIGLSDGSILRWDGNAFSSLDAGVTAPLQSPTVAVRTITPFEETANEEQSIFVGGDFTNAGSVFNVGVAAWNGTGWHLPGNRGAEIARFLPDHLSYLNRVTTSAPIDDADESGIYLAGRFDVIGSVTANSIARWDGHSFQLLGNESAPGLRVEIDVGIESLDAVAGEVNRLVRFDLNGDGTKSLIAAGRFDIAGNGAAKDLAAWDGTEWSSLPQDLAGSGLSLITTGVLTKDAPFGPALFVTGVPSAAGTESTILRWDVPTQSWTNTGGPADGCFVLEMLDDGSGPAMYAGCVNGVYQWDGATWQPLANPLPGAVYSLAAFDDGTGATIYAGVQLADQLSAGDAAVYKLIGNLWESIGTFTGCDPNGVLCTINTLTAFDDGTGQALYAGGGFRMIQGIEASGIARWDGKAWSPLGSEAQGVEVGPGLLQPSASFVELVAPVSFQGNDALLVGGYFRKAGGNNAASLALWRGCNPTTPPCPGDLTGDAVVNADDLGVLLGSFGATVQPGTGADLNADGTINTTDLGILLGQFGNAC